MPVYKLKQMMILVLDEIHRSGSALDYDVELLGRVSSLSRLRINAVRSSIGSLGIPVILAIQAIDPIFAKDDVYMPIVLMSAYSTWRAYLFISAIRVMTNKADSIPKRNAGDG